MGAFLGIDWFTDLPPFLGEEICRGCVVAVNLRTYGGPCPFCRAPTVSIDGEEVSKEVYKELFSRIQQRLDIGDPRAVSSMGNVYRWGSYGFVKNQKKAIELWVKGAELGDIVAHAGLGFAYSRGESVKVDRKKALYHLAIAAKGGNGPARTELGHLELINATSSCRHWRRRGCDTGLGIHQQRAVKHFMIDAKSGDDYSMEEIKNGYIKGHLREYISKEDFAMALRAHKAAKDAMKSEQRTRAAELNSELNAPFRLDSW